MIRSPDPASFDRVTDQLFIGSRIASPAAYERLRKAGVKACVDMKVEGADPWGFESFLWLPTVDHAPPSQVHLQMGIAFLRLCEQGGVPAFVHCMAGVGRSSTLVLAYLLAFPLRASSPAAALEFLSSRRPAVNPTSAQIAAAVEAGRAFSL
jgi:predicted protein tyrosine phosphatase